MGSTYGNFLKLSLFGESHGSGVGVVLDGFPAGLTLDRERLHQLGRLLKPYRCIQRVELLPFHKMGEYKWEQMGLPYRLTDTPAPSAEQVAEAKEIFASFGLPL